MKKLILMLSLFSLSLYGCKKDYNYVPPPPDPTVEIKFGADIMPIFTANCYGSGCHDDGSFDPDLTAANAYTALLTGVSSGNGNKFVDTLNDEASELYVRMIDNANPMPTNGILPKAQTDKVLMWIKQGAKNN